MKFLNLKKIAISFLFAFFSMFAAAYAAADQVSEMFQFESCASLKEGFRAVTIKANDENADTSDLKFNYLDALECNLSIIDKNIYTKASYIIFGEPSIYATEVAKTIVRAGFRFNEAQPEDFTGAFKAAMDAQGVSALTPTVTTSAAISEIMMIFSLVLLIVFIIHYTYNSAYDGEILGKGVAIGWVAARIGITIVLIVPIDKFGGFSAIQIIILVIAALGNLLANVISFMLPLFEFLDKTDFEKIEFDNSPDAYTSISNMVDQSVQSHICDIQNRKAALFMGTTERTAHRDIIEEDSFFQCLQEDYLGETINVLHKTSGRGVGSFKSKHLLHTESCAKDKSDKGFEIECANNTFDVPLNQDGSHDQSRVDYLMDADERIREVARDSISLYCSDRGDNYYFPELRIEIMECADFDGVNIGYQTRGDKDYVTLIQDLDTESFKKKIADETKAIKIDIYKKMVGAVKTQLFDDIINDTSDKLETKLGFSLIKGWMSSASFMLQAGQDIKNMNNAYISEFQRIITTSGKDGINLGSSSLAVKTNVKLATLGLKGHRSMYDRYAKETKESTTSMAHKLVDGGDREAEFLDDQASTSFIMNHIFPGILKLKQMSGGSILSDGTVKESCTSNFSLCRPVGVNPLRDVTEMGTDMMDKGLMYSFLSKGSRTILNWASEKTGSSTLAFGSNIAGLFGFLFTIYMLLGIALVYLPSLLIFAYFLGNAIGWLANVMIFSTISILWVVMHFFPEKNKGFAGKASYGYTKLLDILLRPTFVVFGVFVTYIITSVMLAMLNILFAMTINTFELFNAPNNFMDFIMNYIVYLVYVILIIIVLWRSIKSIYKVPNALMDWFSLENDRNAETWNQMGKMFTDNVTRVLIAKS